MLQISSRKYHFSLFLKIAWLPSKGQIHGLQREKHKHNSCQTRLSTLKSAWPEIHTKFQEQAVSSMRNLTGDRGYARRQLSSPAPHMQKFTLIITLPNEKWVMSLCHFSQDILQAAKKHAHTQIPKLCEKATGRPCQRQDRIFTS